MSTSRVAELQLTLRIAANRASAATALRATVERDVVARVLDELERILHERFGTQSVIRVRRLALRWRLDEQELGTAGLVARLANDLATQVIADVVALPAEERLRPHGEILAVFESDRHADATYLADVVDGCADRWIHDTRVGAATTWRALAQHGADAIGEIVHWLGEMERLEGALALADDDVLHAVEIAVPAAVPVVALVRARARFARGGIPSEIDRRVARDDGERAGAAADPIPDPQARSSSRVAADPLAVPVIWSDADEASMVGTGGVVVDGESVRLEEVDSLPNDGAMHDASRATPAALTAETQAAGVFFLAGRVLEIGLAEALWAAGLPEGDVLALVAGAILGDVEDPAWRWFGGRFDRAPVVPTVEAWAATEVIDVVQLALGRRLVRYGVSLTPSALGAQLDDLAAQITVPVSLPPIMRNLVARCSASLAYIVAARLDRPPSPSDLRTICLRSGQLVLAPAALHVVMPLQAIEIDHRRAGLDQNPGHIPWLGRPLWFELVGGDEL